MLELVTEAYWTHLTTRREDRPDYDYRLSSAEDGKQDNLVWILQWFSSSYSFDLKCVDSYLASVNEELIEMIKSGVSCKRGEERRRILAYEDHTAQL